MERIMIFGAGNTGKRAYEQNYEKYNIQCFLDNDQKKWGKYLYNLPIIQPTKESIEKYSFDYIMIASVFGIKEIETQLVGLGIPFDKIIKIQRNPDVLSPFLRNLADDFHMENINGAVAEIGVFQGESAEKINRYFPGTELYLFDTFNGFPESDIEMEKQELLSEVRASYYSDTSVERVLARMPYPENVRVYKGYFPDTAIGIEAKFCFVRIDVDLYSPTIAALDFFHSLMVHGGCIVVHDYFGESYKGIRKAVAEYLENHSELSKIPIGDMLSIAIVGY